VYDILITLYYIAVSEKRPAYSGVMSAVITFLQCYVIYTLVQSPEVLVDVIAYAVGCGVGTWITVWWKRKSSENVNGFGGVKKHHQ
jgi:hypothetical protein